MTVRSPAILVVEEDPSSREFYQRALTRAGYRVAAVESGVEALRCMAHGAAPDAIIVDVTGPGTSSGADFYRELRARKQTAHIPVVTVVGAAPWAEAVCTAERMREHLYADAVVSVVQDALRHG